MLRARPARRAVGREPELLHRPRLSISPASSGRVEQRHRRARAGRLDDHPAVREDLHPGQDQHRSAQVQGDRSSRSRSRQEQTQGPDPRELPEHRSTSAAAPTASRRPAKTYFGEHVKDLTAAEGAVLAVLIRSPSRCDPAKNPEDVHRAVELRPRRHGRGGLAAAPGPRRPQSTPRCCRDRLRAAGSRATRRAYVTAGAWTSSRPRDTPTRRSTPRVCGSTTIDRQAYQDTPSSA